MRRSVIIEQGLVKLKDGGDGFLTKLLEPNPDQNGIGDVLALNTGQTAASALGLPTEQAPAFVAPPTDRPTDRPALPTVVIIPLATAQFTAQPFQNTPGSLPTFAP
ncbi:MAG: hypothetical protein ABI947_23615 [Chloroflexota bacterium]